MLAPCEAGSCGRTAEVRGDDAATEHGEDGKGSAAWLDVLALAPCEAGPCGRPAEVRGDGAATGDGEDGKGSVAWLDVLALAPCDAGPCGRPAGVRGNGEGVAGATRWLSGDKCTVTPHAAYGMPPEGKSVTLSAVREESSVALSPANEHDGRDTHNT